MLYNFSMNTKLDAIQVAQRIINEGKYIALATSSRDGAPWCSPVFYGVTQELIFMCISSTASRHATNIRETGLAAWSVFWGSKPPENTDGVMFGGEARELVEPEETLMYGNILYYQRFPDPVERSQHPVDLRNWEETGRRIYLFEPKEAYKVNTEDPHGVSRSKLDLHDLMGPGIQHPVTAR